VRIKNIEAGLSNQINGNSDITNFKPATDKKTHIKLSPHEIQSGSSKVNWAEGLIEQLPKGHEGRNSWLMNYGHKKESCEIRERNKKTGKNW